MLDSQTLPRSANSSNLVDHFFLIKPAIQTIKDMKNKKKYSKLTVYVMKFRYKLYKRENYFP